MSTPQIKDNFNEAASVLSAFISDNKNIEKIEAAGNLMVGALRKNKKLISCGNGGSMCDAIHFAEELTGRFRNDRKPIAAVAISDPAHITCTANDYGFDQVFSRYVQGVGNEGDVLLAISTSGNSENVLRAAEKAKQMKIKVVALTGKNGGKLKDLADVEIRVPHSGYADRIQEIHIKIIHSLIQYIETNL